MKHLLMGFLTLITLLILNQQLYAQSSAPQLQSSPSTSLSSSPSNNSKVPASAFGLTPTHSIVSPASTTAKPLNTSSTATPAHSPSLADSPMSKTFSSNTSPTVSSSPIASPNIPTTPSHSLITPQSTDSPPQATPTVLSNLNTIRFRGVELFNIQADVGIYSAQERAKIINKRLKNLESQTLTPEDVKVSHDGTISNVLVGQTIIFTITEQDAKSTFMSRQYIAQMVQERLQEAIIKWQETLQKQKSLSAIKSLILKILLAIGTTLLFAFIFWYIRRNYYRLQNLVLNQGEKYLKDIKINKLTIVSASTLKDTLAIFTKWLYWGIIIIIMYIYFPLVFSYFTITQNLGSILIGYVTKPFMQGFTAFTNYIPNIFVIAVIVISTNYLLKLVHLVFTALEKGIISYPGFYNDWAKPTYQIVRFLILAFAAIVTFPYLPGSGSPAFQSVSMFLGILFSLGSTSAIANVVAGVVMTYMRPFKIGDRVKIADTIGDVIEKSLLVTRIRTIKNVDITVPNSMILGSHIINYSSSAQNDDKYLLLHTTVTIGYDVPWRQVHELLLNAAKDVPFTLAQPKPFILQKSLDDFYVSYELNVYTDVPNKMAVTYSKIHENIQDGFNEAGVEILSPHYRAARDGNQVTIPTDYLPKDYQAPGFRFFNMK